MTVSALQSTLISAIINPLIALLFIIAVVVFLWGVVRFLGYLGSDSSEKETGKKHMLWGIIGMFIMAAALAIINVTVGTFGVQPINSLQPPSYTGQ